jgi:hypothetical protein
MAKKGLLVLVLAALVAGGAFAQIGLSAGFGGNFSANFDSVEYNSTKISMTTIGGGFFGFFDATYVEADIGVLFGGTSVKSSYSGFSLTIDGPDVTILTLGVFGKYPFDLGSSVALFPMLGIQLDLGLGAKQQNGKKMDSDDVADFLNRFWVKLGLGADFNLTESMFLRPSFLYGLNFGTKSYRDQYKSWSPFYHGLDIIRVALGFRF